MRRMFGAAAIALVTLQASALMERATPESQGVDSAAIVEWLDACDRAFYGGNLGTLHGFVIVRHGKVVAEGSWKPFDTLRVPHQLYSHSKSFTSTAIGFLVDDGLLDLDERLVDIFPEYVPANPSENLRQVRVRDLLTMNLGANRTDAESTDPLGDWVKNLMTNSIDNPPGTLFKYDSGATYLCAAIVEKRSGRKMMDLLKERLFDKIGITEVSTTYSPQGIPCGGWGMYMTTRDIARFGQLLLDRGTWEGAPVISSEWIAAATSRQTRSVNARGPKGALGWGGNWTHGYGFQFWRNPSGLGYRADGANGQFTLVLPEQDAVVSLAAGCFKTGIELDLVWNVLVPGMKQGTLPENAAARTALEQKIATLSIAPVDGVEKGCEKFAGVDFAFEKNKHNFREVRFEKDPAGSGWKLCFAANACHSEIPVGFGTWKGGESMRFNDKKAHPLGQIHGSHQVAASGAVRPDGSFMVKVHLLDMPQDLILVFGESNGVKRVDGELRGICGVKFAGSVKEK